MTDLPRCHVCGHTVTLARDASGRFTCWCWCANCSPHERDFREPGVGDAVAAAIAEWQKTATT